MHILLTVTLLLYFSLSQAQNKTLLTGTVKYTDGSAASFVTVSLKNTSIATQTGEDGKFTISAQAGDYVLLISSIGMKPVEQKVSLFEGSITELKAISLEESNHHLDEVAIQGKTEAQTIRESAQAIEVLETKELKTKSIDMAEALAQIKGVNIRRDGGLGSDARFALNGLTDDQIRFFVNGVPLAFTAYSFGFANIPPNLIERIEVYKGVLPIRFGADALGGAVNIVSPGYKDGLHTEGSYQFSSFHTHRLTANVQYANDKTGFFAGINGFYDYTKNDYLVDVSVTNAKGQKEPIQTPRFHDGYIAKGTSMEFGIRNKKWAKELSINFSYGDFYKELQNNNIMVVPYGGVVYGRSSTSSNLKYSLDITKKLSADLITGVSHNELKFTDTSTNVYNWKGEVVRKRVEAGEIGKPSDQSNYENAAYARLVFDYKLLRNHIVRAAVSPTYIHRTGKERRLTDPTGRDPLSAINRLTNFVNGLEYGAQTSSERFQNILFVKQYIQILNAEDVLPGNLFVEKNRESVYYGYGNSSRFLVTNNFYIKASYEYTTRLPNSYEIFGDGALTLKNLNIKPERSHNANLEFNVKGKGTHHLLWNASINAFLRKVENQIILVGSDNIFQYVNVFDANSIGGEFAGQLQPFTDRVRLDLNVTWMEFRNASTQGNYVEYKGDRIPNRPYLFGNVAARYVFPKVFNTNDAFSIFYSGRYIHSFYRGWESAGIKEFKQVIDAQFGNNVGVSYQLPPFRKLNAIVSAEVQNIMDAQLYDNFGVQKPGRAYFLKTTVKF